MRARSSCLLLVALIPAIGCGGSASASNTPDTYKLIAELRQEVNALKKDVSETKARERIQDLTRDFDTQAFLRPGAEGYIVARTDLGNMAFKLHDVQAYANGSRVVLLIGNLTAAGVDGLTAKLEWGNVTETGAPKEDTIRSRSVKFNEELRSGGWTQVRVVLEGVSPAELGFVRVKEVGHTAIKLLR